MSKIEIYTKDYCPYCKRAKDLLRIKGVEFTEYEISHDPEREAEMRQRCGRITVPEIFIDNRFVGGCDDLFELDERGELNALLGKPVDLFD